MLYVYSNVLFHSIDLGHSSGGLEIILFVILLLDVLYLFGQEVWWEVTVLGSLQMSVFNHHTQDFKELNLTQLLIIKIIFLFIFRFWSENNKNL